MDYDALERLVRLRDSGAITDDEFAQQKAVLAGPKARTTKTSSLSWLQRNWQSANRTPILVGVAVAILGLSALVYLTVDNKAAVIDTQSPEERQCQTAIKATLINPETVEFFEFIPEIKASYLSSFEDKRREEFQSVVDQSNAGSGLYGVYAQGMAAAAQSIVDRNLREAVAAESARIDQAGLSTFSYRIKADGQLGNTITSTQHCAANARSCGCE